MILSWKDIVTTFLAAGAAGLYFLTMDNATGYRGGIVLLALMGIAMCAFSGGATNMSNPFIVVSSVLGVTALALIVYGLITGAKIAFILLTLTILALWAISTLRHMLGG